MKRFIFSFLLLLVQPYLLFSLAQSVIFKEYDIRGVVGEEFSEEDTYEIAYAIGTYLLETDNAVKTIALGADGRIHSPLIKKLVAKALLEQGFNVLDIGTCTTPILSFALHTTPVDAGLIITASHNPGEYNGIKIYLREASVSGQGIKRIQHLYSTQEFALRKEEAGNYQAIDLITPYVHHLMELFPHLIGANFDVIIDCGNGAAGTVLPLLVEKMQWKRAKLLYAEVDGTYPHHIADPTVEKYMKDLKEELIHSNAQFGIGFDGDCDRMAPMAKSGRLVKGDQLLTLYSEELLRQFPGSCVVFDISSSKVLHDFVRGLGGIPVIASTGVAQIKKKMAETEALLGGEISCHTIFKDRYFGFDDGVYSMMRLFEILQRTGLSLDEHLNAFPTVFTSPTYRLPCERSLCLQIMASIQENLSKDKEAELITIDGLRIHLPQGWAIIRPSNTEPVISMRFEGYTEEGFVKIKKQFYEMISPYLECSVLL